MDPKNCYAKQLSYHLLGIITTSAKEECRLASTTMYQSTHIRMWAAGQLLADYRTYPKLHALLIRHSGRRVWPLQGPIQVRRKLR